MLFLRTSARLARMLMLSNEAGIYFFHLWGDKKSGARWARAEPFARGRGEACANLEEPRDGGVFGDLDADAVALRRELDGAGSVREDGADVEYVIGDADA